MNDDERPTLPPATPPPRARMPSVTELPSNLFPGSARPADLFTSAQAQGRVLLSHIEIHRDTAQELKEIRKLVAPVANIILRDQQSKAVWKHWATVLAVALPFVSVVFSAFVSWYVATKLGGKP